jgi:hypothetical protein
MTDQSESLAAVAEIPTPQDVTKLLRSYAKTARKAHLNKSYPRRAELMTILTDARARVDRINAPT